MNIYDTYGRRRIQKFAEGGTDAYKGKHHLHKRTNNNFAGMTIGQEIRDQGANKHKRYTEYVEVKIAIRGQISLETKGTVIDTKRAFEGNRVGLKGQKGSVQRAIEVLREWRLYPSPLPWLGYDPAYG